MIYKKVIQIQAESYLEEQYLIQKFPGIVWYPPVVGPASGEGFARFYLPLKEDGKVKEALNEYKSWKEQQSE